jgi:hypothetical protein
VGHVTTGIDPASGRRLYAAIEEVVAEGDFTLEEVARRVGCTPHDVLEVLLRFDRASHVSITPSDGCDEAPLLLVLGG